MASGKIWIDDSVLFCGNRNGLAQTQDLWRVDKVFLWSGTDLETLYPEVFDQQPVIKCKLQMMKALQAAHDFIIGPSLCAGLTLRHYSAFSKCASLTKVDQHYDCGFSSFQSMASMCWVS